VLDRSPHPELLKKDQRQAMFMPRLLFLAIGFLLLGAFSASDETAPVKDLPDEYIAPGHEEAMAAAKASTGSPAAVASTNIKADNVNLDALSDEQKKKSRSPPKSMSSRQR